MPLHGASAAREQERKTFSYSIAWRNTRAASRRETFLLGYSIFWKLKSVPFPVWMQTQWSVQKKVRI